MSDNDARIGATALLRADARGVRTHGLALLPAYAASLLEGHTNPTATTEIDDRGDHIVVDAHNGLGHVASARVMAFATRACASRGVLAVSLRRIGHLGALGIQILPAAEAGFIGILSQNTQRLMGLEGSTAPGIGNNPFAFAVPLPDAPPLVFDAAMSTVSLSRVRKFAGEGKPLPEGWALDAGGKPTTEAAEAAVLWPFGGHKGIALAMLFETLAGSLGGMRPQSTGGLPVGNGAFLLLVNPARFLELGAFEAHISEWTGTYLASNTAARIPGQQAAASEAACRKDGLMIPAAHIVALDQIADRLGLARL
jgi:LDH2 family malate/lactate/ureidoglycolate dehydrogenase